MGERGNGETAPRALLLRHRRSHGRRVVILVVLRVQLAGPLTVLQLVEQLAQQQILSSIAVEQVGLQGGRQSQ